MNRTRIAVAAALIGVGVVAGASASEARPLFGVWFTPPGLPTTTTELWYRHTPELNDGCSEESLKPGAGAKLMMAPDASGFPATYVRDALFSTTGFGVGQAPTSEWTLTQDMPLGFYFVQLTINGVDVPGCEGSYVTNYPPDTVRPGATATIARPPDANGWYNHPVQAFGSSTDPSATCDSPTYAGPDTATANLTVTCRDFPWLNSSTATLSIQYDGTPPTVNCSASLADGATYPQGAVPAEPTCTSADNVSGVASSITSGYGTTSGPHTWRVTVTDNAGNVTTQTRSYTVASAPPPPAGAKVGVTLNKPNIEGNRSNSQYLTFTIRLSEAVKSNVVVNFSTADGSAVAPGDYTARSGSVTFKPGGNRSITVKVYITPDSVKETDETMTVTTNVVSGPAANAPSNGNVATGVILNDD